MALKQVAVSDISGKDIPEGKHARIVVQNHPALVGFPVELDASEDEAAKIQLKTVELINLWIFEPGDTKGHPVSVDVVTFAGLFKNGEVGPVLNAARHANQPRMGKATRGPGKMPAKSKTDKIDYKAAANYGLEHRGRVTEAEAQLVRENLKTANTNRAREGQAPIDPKDEKMIKRYSL